MHTLDSCMLYLMWILGETLYSINFHNTIHLLLSALGIQHGHKRRSSYGIYVNVKGEWWRVILTQFVSLCAVVPAVEAGAGHGERVQFRGADLQQHQRAGQTLLAHLRLGPDQIPRVTGHDPQVALFSPYSSTGSNADTDN